MGDVYVAYRPVSFDATESMSKVEAFLRFSVGNKSEIYRFLSMTSVGSADNDHTG